MGAGGSRQGRFSRLDQAYEIALDWLFPARCGGCGRLGTHWCKQCQAGVEHIRQPFCSLCGTPLASLRAQCPACQQHHFAFDAARSWGRYSGELRQAILKLKRRKDVQLATALSQGLRELLAEQGWQVDILVPIALAPVRHAERGFNQVELLAQPLLSGTSMRWLPGGLQRVLDTKPQMQLTVNERWGNMRSAFQADPQQVADQNVLVVDDILTTGATLDAAGRSLKQAGAKHVYALTLARTLLGRDS